MSNLEVKSTQETNQAKPKAAPKFIYRAVIKKDDDSVFVTYRNSQGKKVTFEPDRHYNYTDHYPNLTSILFNTVNKYFTGKSPNITPEEQVQLRADIAKQIIPGMRGKGDIDVYSGLDFVLKTFSDEASEGGKNITPNEVYQIYEIFQKWTSCN